jgi:hypothetical protein
MLGEVDMPKELIFLIHGVGSYTKKVMKPNGEPSFTLDQEGWFKSCAQQLNEIFDKVIVPSDYRYKGKKFQDFFEIIPIYYDDIFEEYRHAWATQSATWAKFQPAVASAVSGESSIISSVTNFLTGASADNFGWANVADAIMYQSLLVASTVRSRVKLQILKALNTHKPSGFHFIAHSLGTRVLHDVWDALATDPKIQTAALQSSSGLKVVCMLSNVVQLLYKGSGEVDSQALKPASASRTWANPDVYINANHKYDLIGRIDPMDRPTDWPAIGFKNLDTMDLIFDLSTTEADRALKWDKLWSPHQFNSYMLQPELALTLWKSLLSQSDAWEQNTAPKFSAYAATKTKFSTTARDFVKNKISTAISSQSQYSDINLRIFAKIIASYV